MTRWNRGDVVLVRFVFADEKGAKLRPGLVLSSQRYHAGRQEAILAAMTSNLDRNLFGDHEVVRWREAGLPLPTTVTAIIRTIKQQMIVSRIGRLAATDLRAVEENVRTVLELLTTET